MSEYILIVEEHPALRKALRDWLAFSFSNYRVITSSSYLEAINRIKEDSPRFVVMDFNMTGINGQHAIQRIRAFAPSCKIVILTFMEDESYRSIIASAGANAQVSKQSLGTNLIPTMNALLNGR
jgi:two-component system nitrate/nitrite response regulator NarP